ncbi:hypothetical protein BSZ39_04080 [Bowdeniella nasicola]|uniref:MEMO1 family protein BSZ39_04080 n=1 Tax=Bowdeniella nasicola TaxID=208480 RepID=A0A1Q5Q401_9ACTO|nr:AmmeMemoRadiSam system protein B [Bowdeniella nasicola]OKL54412.1 hypothetical protein BSZ39_04080 [Bowdeniella nasicola]
MTPIRPPAVAGSFYPADPEKLAASVDEMLAQVPAPKNFSRIVIAPHAGHMYSGQLAAHAYRQLDPATRRVAVLGPTHRVGIAAMALTGADGLATPLGTIDVDVELTELVSGLADVVEAPVVHAQEHSIEVHIPFLQRHLEPGFTLLPIAVGSCSAESVAAVIDAVYDAGDTAIVISSDLSHFLTDESARHKDAYTIAQILSLAGPLDGYQACGAYPINGLVRFARGRAMTAEILAAGNSADVSGDTSRVVGYASLRFDSDGTDPRLVDIAYRAIADELGIDVPGSPPEMPEEVGSSFVTLTIDGKLRGCIGNLRADRPLATDISENARAAATRDPRFPPLRPEEFAATDIEVSVLSTPEPMPATTRAEVIAQLRPGIDGVILDDGVHRATFLPQVWEQLPEPNQFLTHLLAKAGLEADEWPEDMRVSTYTATPHIRRANQR